MVLKTSDVGAGPAGTETVKLQRAILIGGERQEAGSVLTLPKPLAMQLIGAMQAVRAEPPASEPTEPPAHRATRSAPKGQS